MRRGIAGVLGGRVQQVELPKCRYRPMTMVPNFAQLRRRIEGERITRLDRAGKRVVLVFGNDDRLVFEPRMTGLVLVADPPDIEHLRLRLLLDECEVPELLFWDRRGIGVLRLYSADEFAQALGDNKLGPDALGLSGSVFRERFGGSRRAIKVALLDQRAVAGIGNLYASEILHRCGIHPERRCDQLTSGDWARIAEATTEILETAIRYEGSTLSDGTYRNALNGEGGYQSMHRVYDRAGNTCGTCGSGEIRRIVQAQRSTFFCPVCQTKRRRKAK